MFPFAAADRQSCENGHGRVPPLPASHRLAAQHEHLLNLTLQKSIRPYSCLTCDLKVVEDLHLTFGRRQGWFMIRYCFWGLLVKCFCVLANDKWRDLESHQSLASASHEDCKKAHVMLSMGHLSIKNIMPTLTPLPNNEIMNYPSFRSSPARIHEETSWTVNL